MADSDSFTEMQLRELARSNRPLLLQYLRKGYVLDGVETAQAAEALGDITQGMVGPELDDVISTLIRCLAHPVPVAREGTIYGLAYHLDRVDVILALKELRAKETSRGVLEVVGNVLTYEV